MKLTPYSEVLLAARETAAKMRPRDTIYMDAGGRDTAAVSWSPGVVSISMPTLPPDTMMTRAEIDEILGFLVHELLHPKHTASDTMPTALSKGGADLAGLVNVLEDVRMERIELNDPNGIRNAKHLLGVTAERVARLCLDEDGNAWTGDVLGDLTNGIAMLGRLDNGLNIPTASKAYAPTVAQSPAAPLIAEAIARVHVAKNSNQLIALAEELLAKARQTPQGKGQGQGQPGQGKGQGANGQGQNQDQGQGQEGQQEGQQGQGEEGQGKGQDEAQQGQQGQGQGQGKGKGKEGQGKEGQGKEGQGKGEGEGQGQGKGQGQGQPQGKAGQGSGDKGKNGSASAKATDLSGAVKDIVDTHAKRSPKTQNFIRTGSRQLPFFRKCLTRPVDPIRAFEHSVASVLVTARNAISTPARLRQHVARILKSPDRTGLQRNEMSGRLDMRQGARIAAGATQGIYMRRWHQDAIKTGVVLLLDGSSSMDKPGRRDSAIALALALGDAIEQAGGELLVAQFRTHDQHQHNGELGALLVAKDWSRRMKAAERNIAQCYVVGGSTHLSPGIMGAAQMLKARQHLTRRIVIALTDGECDYGVNGVHAAETYAERRGVRVVGIGCQFDVRPSFTRAINVMNLADIATMGMEGLVKAVEGRA